MWVSQDPPSPSRPAPHPATQSCWGWEDRYLLNQPDSCIFLGLNPGLWGLEENLKEPCWPLGFGLIPHALGNEPSWPLSPLGGPVYKNMHWVSQEARTQTLSSELHLTHGCLFLSILRSRGPVHSMHVSGAACSSVSLESRFSLLTKKAPEGKPL